MVGAMARLRAEATAHKSLIVRLNIPSLADSTSNGPTAQQPKSSERVQTDDPMDVDDAAEDGQVVVDESVEKNAGDVDETSEDDSVDAWPLEKHDMIIGLFQSGKSNDELLQLTPKDIRGVNLLQLRLNYNMQDLLNAYNTQHEDQKLHQSTIKKAFSNAFNDLAELSGVSVEDLKKGYNKVTKATKTRKQRGKLHTASNQAGVMKRSARFPRAAREYTPAEPAVTNAKESNTTSAKPETPKAKTERLPRKKTVKAKNAATPQASPEPQMSEDEIAAVKHLSELRAAGADIPALNFYHGIVKAFNEKQGFNRLTTDQLREIDYVDRVYTAEQVAQSINVLIPGYATEEGVRDLAEKARKEMILPGYGNDGYHKGYDMFLPAGKL